jgi:hypothetical protein
VVADGLSRIPHWKATALDEEEFTLPAFTSTQRQQQSGSQPERISEEESYRLYLQDSWYQQTVERLLAGENNKRFWLVNVKGEYLLAY